MSGFKPVGGAQIKRVGVTKPRFSKGKLVRTGKTPSKAKHKHA